VISPIGIVPIPLYLLRRNENVFPIFPAPCIDFAVYILDVGRIAVRVIATAEGRVVGHMPC
jgi:hypothetical protein